MKAIFQLAIVFLLCICLNEGFSAEITPRPPNVIYIMADDLGYGELGCYGQKKIKTPELDKMAAAGLRFTQHYAGTSVCAPTRCSLMTGLHTGHCYVRANSPGYPNAQTPIPLGTETIAKMMKRSGYQTACIGKWGLGNYNNDGGALHQGFDHFFGYYDQRHAHNYFTDHLYRDDQRIELDGKTYSHDLMTQEALGFIENNKNQSFFLYLPYCIPHTKFQVPELGEYAKFSDWDSKHRIHAAMITRMDRDVGRIVRKLEELGLSDNTLVMFTSDHGAHGIGKTSDFFKSSGVLRGVKRSLYEGGIRTPLIALWPGKITPGTTDHASAFWDMMATLADLCGGQPKAKHDGISFLPTLLGKTTEQKEHEFLYWELFEYGKHNRAIRQGKWKGIITNYFKSTKLELYDLENDPSESNNVASKHPERIAAFEKLISSARIKSEIWNVESKGFNLEAACKATGIEPPKRNKKRRLRNSERQR